MIVAASKKVALSNLHRRLANLVMIGILVFLASLALIFFSEAHELDNIRVFGFILGFSSFFVSAFSIVAIVITSVWSFFFNID
jgi:uncharacterized membrane protein